MMKSDQSSTNITYWELKRTYFAHFVACLLCFEQTPAEQNANQVRADTNQRFRVDQSIILCNPSPN